MNRSNKRKWCRHLVAPLRVRWRASTSWLAILHAPFFLHVLSFRWDIRSHPSLSLSVSLSSSLSLSLSLLSPSLFLYLSSLGRRNLLTRHGASVHENPCVGSHRRPRESITPCIFTHNSNRKWLMKNIWIKRAVLTCHPVRYCRFCADAKSLSEVRREERK